jgi:hypothetical protein
MTSLCIVFRILCSLRFYLSEFWNKWFVSLQYRTENTPIIEVSLSFDPISLSLLVWDLRYVVVIPQERGGNRVLDGWRRLLPEAGALGPGFDTFLRCRLLHMAMGQGTTTSIFYMLHIFMKI